MKNKNNIVIINTLEELKKFESNLNNNENNYLFRGQYSSEWKLQSSYKREINKRCKKINKNKNFINNLNYGAEYQINYIQNKLREKNKKETKKDEKSDLEILAEFQHQGLETLLIDFTKNFYKAVWFAVSDNNSNKYIHKNKFFRIYLLQYRDEQVGNEYFFKINIDETYLYSNSMYYSPYKSSQLEKIYKCPKKIINSKEQESYFILDNLDNLETYWNIESILISFKLRNEIIKFLDSNSINSTMLFPTLKGLYSEFKTYSKESLNFEGMLFDGSEKYNKALKCFKNAIELDSLNIYLLWKTANTLRHKKKYNKALEIYDQAIKLITKENKKDFFRIYMEAAICLAKRKSKNNYQKAIKCFDKVTNIKPNYIDPYENSGILSYKINEYNDALNYFTKVIKLDSTFSINSIVPYIWKNKTLFKLKNIDDSIKFFDLTIRKKQETKIINFSLKKELSKLKCKIWYYKLKKIIIGKY